MRCVLIALGFMLSVTFSHASAQERGPRILVKADPGLAPIKISDAEVKVDIHGYVAETSITLCFKNPNNRILEGELYFPQPDGAVISGYALDENGTMIDGVVVERQKPERCSRRKSDAILPQAWRNWSKATISRRACNQSPHVDTGRSRFDTSPNSIRSTVNTCLCFR